MTTAPMSVSQEESPCVLHRTHKPISVINEMHHPFPQEWQKDVWGEVRDKRMVSLCATGHNTVHAAISYYLKHSEYPSWCIGKTRDLAERAFELKNEATNSINAVDLDS